MATGQGQYTTPLVILSFVPVDSLPLPEAHFLSTDLDLYVGWVTVCLKKKSMKYGGSWSWTERSSRRSDRPAVVPGQVAQLRQDLHDRAHGRVPVRWR